MKLCDLLKLDCTPVRMTVQSKHAAIIATIGWAFIYLFAIASAVFGF